MLTYTVQRQKQFAITPTVRYSSELYTPPTSSAGVPITSRTGCRGGYVRFDVVCLVNFGQTDK